MLLREQKGTLHMRKAKELITLAVVSLLVFAGTKLWCNWHYSRELAEQIKMVKITKLEQLWINNYKKGKR